MKKEIFDSSFLYISKFLSSRTNVFDPVTVSALLADCVDTLPVRGSCLESADEKGSKP